MAELRDPISPQTPLTYLYGVPVSPFQHNSQSRVQMQPIFLIVQCHYGTDISDVRKDLCLSQLSKANSSYTATFSLPLMVFAATQREVPA